MFTSRVEVLIARPLDEVFAFVADVRNRPSWDDSVMIARTTQKNLDRGCGRPKTLL